MSQEAKRYKLIESNGKMILVSPTSLAILNHLKGHEAGLEYEHFEKLKPRIPVNSLYVFMERLEKAGLIKRSKRSEGTPKRIRTFITASAPFVEHKMTVIK